MGMPSRNCRLVVFDLAGTTMADDGQVGAALRLTLAEHGVDARDDQVAAVRGRSKRTALRELVSGVADAERRATDLYATFLRRLRDACDHRAIRPVPGAEAVFATLRTSGRRLALTTGFDRETTVTLLTSLKWMPGTFDAIVCSDDVRLGRPAPDMIVKAMNMTGVLPAADVANVGDTSADLCAAHAAGVRWNVGVWTGAHSRARLLFAPHTHLVESIRDLPELS
jgi:phosphoglycolate phosphatase